MNTPVKFYSEYKGRKVRAGPFEKPRYPPPIFLSFPEPAAIPPSPLPRALMDHWPPPGSTSSSQLPFWREGDPAISPFPPSISLVPRIRGGGHWEKPHPWPPPPERAGPGRSDIGGDPSLGLGSGKGSQRAAFASTRRFTVLPPFVSTIEDWGSMRGDEPAGFFLPPKLATLLAANGRTATPPPPRGERSWRKAPVASASHKHEWLNRSRWIEQTDTTSIAGTSELQAGGGVCSTYRCVCSWLFFIAWVSGCPNPGGKKMRCPVGLGTGERLSEKRGGGRHRQEIKRNKKGQRKPYNSWFEPLVTFRWVDAGGVEKRGSQIQTKYSKRGYLDTL